MPLGIRYIDYPGKSLEEKHGWFEEGPGAAAATQVGDSLKRIADRLDVSNATIGAGFIERKLGSSWEGGAADAASGRSSSRRRWSRRSLLPVRPESGRRTSSVSRSARPRTRYRRRRRRTG